MLLFDKISIIRSATSFLTKVSRHSIGNYAVYFDALIVARVHRSEFLPHFEVE